MVMNSKIKSINEKEDQENNLKKTKKNKEDKL